MSTDPNKPPIQQATPFQRFTIRLVDGHFMRIPKSDLPVVHGVDQSATSNQTEIRDLFRMVNGRFESVAKPGVAGAADLAAKPPPEPAAAISPVIPDYPDPTFDPPVGYRLPEEVK